MTQPAGAQPVKCWRAQDVRGRSTKETSGSRPAHRPVEAVGGHPMATWSVRAVSGDLDHRLSTPRGSSLNPQHTQQTTGCARCVSSRIHEPGTGRGTDIRRAEIGHRRPASGSLRATSCKRQRGRPEARQSGGQSVPVGAAPRCRCCCAGSRQESVSARKTRSVHHRERMQLLQTRGVPRCRS